MTFTESPTPHSKPPVPTHLHPPLHPALLQLTPPSPTIVAHRCLLPPPPPNHKAVAPQTPKPLTLVGREALGTYTRRDKVP